MANPTTNFGWVMPTSTDLVTDLPADFEVFGQAVDTAFQYLNGGTTGQVLSKTSNTNLAFTWINNDVGDITEVTAGIGISGGGTSGAVTVTNSMATAITTSGDLIQGTGSGTFARLGTGTNGQFLTTNGTTNSWTSISTGGMTLISTTSLTGSTITLSSIPATYNNLQLVIRGFKSTTDGQSYNLRFNGVTGSNYVASTSNTGTNTFSSTSIESPGNDNSVNNGLGVHDILDYANTATWKLCNSVMFGINQTTTTSVDINRNFGVFNSTSAISSITIFTGAGTFSGGTALLYGVK